MNVIALLAPGQGSQTPGMLNPWLELPGAADRLTLWSKASGLDLTRLGTTATTDEITDTSITQPLVVAAALRVAQPVADDSIDLGGLVGPTLLKAYLPQLLSAAVGVALGYVIGRRSGS